MDLQLWGPKVGPKPSTKTRKPKAKPSAEKGGGIALIEHLSLFMAQRPIDGDSLV